MPRGRPILERRRQIAELRAKGLTYREIGERFGVTGQAICESFQHSAYRDAAAIRCEKCKTVITQIRHAAMSKRPAYCTNCLPPTATFADRLKVRRLAAGMTLLQLSRTSGVHWSILGKYEAGMAEPTWSTLAKLIRVLGLEWLAVK